MRTPLLAATLALLLAAVGPVRWCAARRSRTEPGSAALTVFYTGGVHGTLEPCGCTSDPLGDVARYAALVRTAARSGPTLLVDGGGIVVPRERQPQGEGGQRAAGAGSWPRRCRRSDRSRPGWPRPTSACPTAR